MDRGAWQAVVHGVARVGHDLATKPLPYRENDKENRENINDFQIWVKKRSGGSLDYFQLSCQFEVTPNKKD